MVQITSYSMQPVSCNAQLATCNLKGKGIKIKAIIHEAEEGGYWAEIPAIVGCATQGDTFPELVSNIYKAVEVCLSVDLKDIPITETDKVIEVAV